jgi:hypothetical protein
VQFESALFLSSKLNAALSQKHDPVETISSPGYTLTRSRERIKMQISYDNFFLPTPTDEK